MNGKLILLAFLSSLLVGCREREIPADIERDVVSLPARFATGEYRSFVDSLYNRISGLPDSSSRVKCYRFVWDTLFNIEVDTGNPNSFCNLITAVEENLYRSITYLYAGEQSRDEIVRRQIDRIIWTKRQLDRMRPERMITSEDYESPKDQISAWRNAYLFVKRSGDRFPVQGGEADSCPLRLGRTPVRDVRTEEGSRLKWFKLGRPA